MAQRIRSQRWLQLFYWTLQGKYKYLRLPQYILKIKR